MLRAETEHNLVCVGIGALFNENFSSICLALGDKPDYLYDNDKQKWGQTFHEVRCLTFDEMIVLPKASKIVFTTRLVDQFYQQFESLGFTDIAACSFRRSESRLQTIYNLKEADQARKRSALKLRELGGSWCYISGASRGIGAYIAELLAEMGVNLVIHSSQSATLEKLAATALNKNVEVIRCEANLSNLNELEHHCSWIKNTCPDLDFAYLNAGVSLSSKGSFDGGSLEGWTQTFQVNTLAPWKITSTLLNSSKIRNSGKLFFISSSISSKLMQQAYACSKAALNKMVDDLSRASAHYGVEFCLIDPGWISTDMGGEQAPESVESLFPGTIFPACSAHSCNGSWISVQDYRDCSIEEAIARAYQLGDLGEV